MSRVFHFPTMSEEDWLEAKARTDEEWARVKPAAGWRTVVPSDNPFADVARMMVKGKTTLVFSAGKHDGKWWLDVSIAHPGKTPSYLELAEVKEAFIGADRQAVLVFAKRTEHVNIHPRALHLWACLEPDGDGLPRFGESGTI